jgi:lysozyme
MQPGEACIKIIQQSENCAKRQPDGTFKAYPDPGTGGDPWTIGWGSTGSDIKPGTVWTQQQCDDRFSKHVAEFAQSVTKAIGSAPTTQHQFDAMVSLAYNIGANAFAKSTVLKRHIAKDYKGAAEAFAMWNKGGGKVLGGLVKRRAAEAALYARP